MFKKVVIFLFLLTVFNTVKIKSQVLFNMGQYRNLAYISNGYTSAFENTTIGIGRREYIKFLKREVIGVLDISLPLSHHFFTRHTIRKGFQLDLYNQNNIRVPFMFASSSIIREPHYFKFHDVTAEFSFAPGKYTNKYTIALDFRYELIVFRHVKYLGDYYKEDGKHTIKPNAHSHWEEPIYSIGKVGIMLGLNLNHFVAYLKTGYERLPLDAKQFTDFLPGYAVIGCGYKFGTKPLETIKEKK